MLDNAAWRAVQNVLAAYNERDLDRLGSLLHPDVTEIDRRRGPTAPPVGGRAEVVADLGASIDVGLSLAEFEVVAVRGEQLVAARGGARTTTGLESSTVEVFEVDASGRLLRFVHYSAHDLAAALEELDERYVSGEGAPHAPLVRQWGALARAFNGRDWLTVESLLTPEVVVVGRQKFSPPGNDRTSVVDSLRARVDQVPDAVLIARTFECVGAVTLVQYGMVGHTSDGGEVEWANWMVTRLDGGRTAYGEIFDIEDAEAARARFEEMADEPRHTLDNAAWRAAQRGVAAFNERDFDTLRNLARPDVVHLDLGRGPTTPPLVGRDAFIEYLDATVEIGMTHVEYELVAVRGERLVLARGVNSGDRGFERIVLTLWEHDAAGLQQRVVVFSDDDLERAMEELDERYVAGEGAAHAAVVHLWRETVKAFNRRDWSAFKELHTPDMVSVSRMKFPDSATDSPSSVDSLRSVANAVPDAVLIVRALEADRNVVLTQTDLSGHTPDGGEVQWAMWVVSRLEGSRGAYSENFDLEDEATARETFARLSDEQRRGLDNAAWRAVQRSVAAYNERDFDTLRARARPDVEHVDHRRGPSAPPLVGHDPLIAYLQANVDTGMTHIEYEPVAVRGERLVLARGETRTDGGFERIVLSLFEYDAAGLQQRTVVFSEEDLAGALEELDKRYLAGEGADLVPVVHDYLAAANRHDWAALEATLAPNMAAVTHNRVPWPLHDRPTLVDAVRELMADVPDVVLVERTFEAERDAAIAWVDARGHAPDGGEVHWSYWAVYHAGAQIRRMELFDFEDESAARARFEELTREDPRSPHPDNAAVRTLVRGAWLFSFGRDEQAVRALIVDDIVHVDRRSLLRTPEARDADVFMGNVVASAELFGRAALEPVAVRSERLALVRLRLRDPGGFEVGMLSLSEIDDRGRLCRLTNFDEADLASALDALDARHAELVGEAYTSIDGWWGQRRRLFEARDWDGFNQLLAPDVIVTDHRPIGFGSVDREGYLAWLRSSDDTHRGQVLVCVKTYSTSSRCLAVNQIFGTTVHEGEVEWSGSIVTTHALDGRAVTIDVFTDDQWVEALALFDDAR